MEIPQRKDEEFFKGGLYGREGAKPKIPPFPKFIYYRERERYQQQTKRPTLSVRPSPPPPPFNANELLHKVLPVHLPARSSSPANKESPLLTSIFRAKDLSGRFGAWRMEKEKLKSHVCTTHLEGINTSNPTVAFSTGEGKTNLRIFVIFPPFHPPPLFFACDRRNGPPPPPLSGMCMVVEGLHSSRDAERRQEKLAAARIKSRRRHC